MRYTSIGVVLACTTALGFAFSEQLFPGVSAEAPPSMGDAPVVEQPIDSQWSSSEGVFRPYGSQVPGVLTFRGNPTRTFYGTGPIPSQAPQVRWTYPRTGVMCSISYLGEQGDQWCGMGWTGQPAVFERDGKTLLAFGGFDKKVHLLDAETGLDVATPLLTGDIIKGSPTVDPDGFPLIYVGSRDNNLRVVSFEGKSLKTLWSLNAYDVEPVLWDDDWDASPLVLKDYLLVGGENGHFHAVKLNRSYDKNGKVVVKPVLVANVRGWDEDLLKVFPKPAVSIENSVSIYGNTVYFANSAGLLQGWDLTPLDQGLPPKRVYRLWLGDDTDASIVQDSDGFLYVAVEYELGNQRSKDVGQILKINPRIPGDQGIVWRQHVRSKKPDGVWATPALTATHLIVPTDSGRVLGLNRRSGALDWSLDYGSQPLWSSPNVVDNTLVLATCGGSLDAYDLKGALMPQKRWSFKAGKGCFEASAAIWKGRTYIGNRDGKLYGIW